MPDLASYTLRTWLGIALAVFLVDHATKFLASSMLDYHEIVPVLPFFSFILVHNTGAAFSLLADAGGWQRWFFIVVGIVATVIIVYLLRRHANEPRQALPLALLLGGALGNVIDRVLLGYVVDFLYLHYRDFSWPVFNLADTAIFVGALWLIWDSLFGKPSAKSPT